MLCSSPIGRPQTTLVFESDEGVLPPDSNRVDELAGVVLLGPFVGRVNRRFSITFSATLMIIKYCLFAVAKLCILPVMKGFLLLHLL